MTFKCHIQCMRKDRRTRRRRQGRGGNNGTHQRLLPRDAPIACDHLYLLDGATLILNDVHLASERLGTVSTIESVSGR
jgi:hypothetical protein